MQAPSPPPALPVRTRRRSRQPESTPGDHQADGEADAGPDGSELRPCYGDAPTTSKCDEARLDSDSESDSEW